jgi:hypothetical protein
VLTGLCLDQLKSARARRETCMGPWLPEPVMAAAEDTIDDDFTLPLLLAPGARRLPQVTPALPKSARPTLADPLLQRGPRDLR